MTANMRDVLVELREAFADAGKPYSEIRASTWSATVLRMIDAALSRTEGEWRPIETAPKDASEILVYREDAGVMLARWIAPCDFMSEQELDLVDEAYANESDWFAADFIQGGRLSNDGLPTHWMPLPCAPDHSSTLDADRTSDCGETSVTFTREK